MKRAAVYRGAWRWWVDTCLAHEYRPGGPWQLRALAAPSAQTRDFPTHTEALAHALVEVGLGRRDTSETIPDSPGDPVPGTETEGSRR